MAKMLQAALMTLPGIAVVTTLALGLGGVHARPGELAATVAILLVGSVPFSTIALIIGQALDGQASNTGSS